MAHKNVWSNRKYHPAYCEMLLNAFAQGNTISQFCRDNDIGENCFYKWCKTYEEFGKTYEKAKAFKRAYHESELKANLENQDINTTVYKYYMRMVVGIEDKPEANVTVNNNQLDPEIIKKIEEFQAKFKSDH